MDRPLTSLGSYYQAGTDADLNTADPTGNPPLTPAGDTIATATKPVEVYSYENAGGDTAYAVLHGVNTVGATTTYSYATADIFVDHDPDGEGDVDTQVNAMLPVARDYSHIHFGVWASLGDASSTGSQTLADLGIGFVQSIGERAHGGYAQQRHGPPTRATGSASVQGSHPTGEGEHPRDERSSFLNGQLPQG